MIGAGASNWQRVPLGDAVELAYGRNLPKGNRRGGSIPVYGSNGVTGWHDTPLVPGPTVIVGRKGSAGAVHLVDGPCYPIDTTYYTRIRPGFEFDTRFLAYMLRQLDLSRLRTSTGVPGLTREDTYRELISVPPLSEQSRVADLLSRAENIVRMRKEAEAKAKEIIPTLFLDMFGDPASHVRFERQEASREAVPLVRLGEVLESAEYGTSTKASDQGAGIPMIRMGNVDVTGRTDLTDLKSVKLSAEDRVKYGLRSGDILFNRTNSKELVGKTGQWRGECDAVAASYFIRVRTDTSKALPDYVWAFMNSRTMKRVLFGMARGAIGQSNINAKELRAIEMPLPALEAQRRFGDRVVECLELEVHQARATGQAEFAFQSLLAGAFRE